MEIIKTKLPGVTIIEPQVFGDERGFFVESFQVERYRDLVGIDQPFVQDNHSRSTSGVLRGLHFQKSRPQGKLVRVVTGEVYDVAVDINPQSSTFGQYEGVFLSEANKRQFWVPPGYAHGFVVVSDVADFEYKCTDYYDPSDEGSVAWDDPLVGVDWPVVKPTLSPKDAKAPTLMQFVEPGGQADD
ncbi:dTDP-4-dehydrorhamnose 3,5-epimerase [Pseudomaricurvus alkylphenolicus]|uniref:dTDP-4-dehydrorhamnose 3,5-epimerase n=1 Tax=Pseudomaricurvus alkylphenolicus TaxID=1306991 RepID=UPI0014217BC1|nr:dTDP-4-dehydrorhamnose 3,5-epimerase [Pseudomaricurvus alkylphenolicus]NIB39705.1 dTDP-4-dehydrorhamnose 3,5-epimerase [Pseudomaricurvus alkylphenolicus]